MKSQATSTVKWPDLSKDQKAWELAKMLLGPDADLHLLINKANEIKGAL